MAPLDRVIRNELGDIGVESQTVASAASKSVHEREAPKWEPLAGVTNAASRICLRILEESVAAFELLDMSDSAIHTNLLPCNVVTRGRQKKTN